MAKRLSKEQKHEITKCFSEGETIDQIINKFRCSKLTIIRNLKKDLGTNKYKELIVKQKSYIKSCRDNDSQLAIRKDREISNVNTTKINNSDDLCIEEQKFTVTEFVELAPLNEEIDNIKRKDFSSISIFDINFPNIVYMVVNKNIELEIKLLKEHAEWSFLPLEDLNRKTIRIFFDPKVAKTFCNKEQKVIKVPNTDVFKIVAPILRSRGISRIVSPDQLISLK